MSDPLRQSRSAFQASYGSDTAQNATIAIANAKYGPPLSQAANTPSGDSSKDSAYRQSRDTKNARTLKRLRMGCQLYGWASLALSLWIGSTAIAISGIAVACLGLGLVVGAWLTEAA